VEQLTLYDYLTFVLPGGVVIASITIAYSGWPWPRPDATSLVLLTGAAFVVGYAIAGVANFLEPAFLGSVPGRRADPLWGTLTGPSRLKPDVQQLYRRALLVRYGATDEDDCYRRGVTELRQKQLVPMLATFNQHLGFSRGMAVASTVSTVGLLVCTALGHHHVLVGFWCGLGVVGTVLFIYRFRRFWRWYGESVLRGVAELERSENAARADPPERRG
jgi:hypothetical protein